MTRLLLSLLLLFLAGCATQYDQLRNYAGPDAGTVVASVGMTTENTMQYVQLTLRQKGTQNLAKLQFAPKAAAAFGGTTVDFQDPKGSYSLLQMRLPPGEYEIFQYSSGANYGTSMVWINAPEGFAIPFTVRRGETTYIGQYRVGLNLSGGRPASSFLEVSNERQRDIAKLQPSPTTVNDEATTILKDSAQGTKRLN